VASISQPVTSGIVLHAVWEGPGGRFLAWGESPEKYIDQNRLHQARRANRGQGKRSIQQYIGAGPLHPFALSDENFSVILSPLLKVIPDLAVEIVETIIPLPTIASNPCPSPELLRRVTLDSFSTSEVNGGNVTSRAKNKTQFSPWKVPAMSFTPSSLLEMLLLSPDILPASCYFSRLWMFWMEVAKIGLEIILQHDFLPSVGNSGDHQEIYHPSWIATFRREQQERVATLARDMPPACFATFHGDQVSISHPETTIVQFVNLVLDGFVKAAMQENTLETIYHKKRGRKNLEDDAVRGFLEGLVNNGNGALDLESRVRPIMEPLVAWLGHDQEQDSQVPFRTCFKLDPPGDDASNDSSWTLGYYLQATDDPSLLVPAESVWKERSSVLKYLKHRFENPQERLLVDLGRAAKIFPEIDKTLKETRPSELVMTSAMAYNFLLQYSLLLEQAGFGIIVPAWSKQPASKLGVVVSLHQKSSSSTNTGILGLSTIVAFDWQISMGDEVISPEEFEHIASLKIPLVRARGKWVMLKPEDVEKIVSMLKSSDEHEVQELTLATALQASATGSLPGFDVPIMSVSGDHALKEFLSHLSGTKTLTPVPQPSNFSGTLRPYQERGLSWLAFMKSSSLGSCLADDMGLGKTIQVIAILLHMKNARGGCLEESNEPSKNGKKQGKKIKHDIQRNEASETRASLLICPMSIMDNWKKEINRFAPSMIVFLHHGKDRLDATSIEERALSSDVIITTYALAARDKELLYMINWNTIIIDEAQNIKNQSTKQTQAIKSFKANWKIALTGTPVENRLADLWSIMDFLNPDFLGSFNAFHKSFAIPIERYHDPTMTSALKRLVQPFVLRRLKTDKSIIKDLPEKVEMKDYCNLTTEQASLYEAVVKEMIEKIDNADGIQRKGLILSTMMKLKQICNHPAQFLHDGSRVEARSGKLTRLEELVHEIVVNKEKALIFTQFTEMGELLKDHLRSKLGINLLYLHGGSTKKQREAMVESFQNDSSFPVFILSLKAGGVGLNLTAATNVVHFDRWWNPAVENQASDRIYRIGQVKNVQIHKFICSGTLEERIDDMIESKKQLAQNIIGTGEYWITELTTAQIKELVALKRDIFIGGE